MKLFTKIFGLIIITALISLTACKSEEEKQIEEAIKSYKMIGKNGDPMDKCSYSSMISASYLAIQDQDNYKKWKRMEQRDCKNAAASFFK